MHILPAKATKKQINALRKKIYHVQAHPPQTNISLRSSYSTAQDAQFSIYVSRTKIICQR